MIHAEIIIRLLISHNGILVAKLFAFLSPFSSRKKANFRCYYSKTEDTWEGLVVETSNYSDLAA